MDGSPATGISLKPQTQPLSRKDKVQDVLNEARTLVLGAQVLVGFQYNAVFHPGFERLSEGAKWLIVGSLVGMLLVVALGMAGDFYVVLALVGHSERLALGGAAALLAMFAVLWFAVPMLARR